MSPADDPILRRFIEEAGSTTQALGVGRVVGQIYAYLFFSETPRTLDDMKEALGISKGSASTGVRQLEQWGAAQRVWVKGDRKDYYTAGDYFGRIVRNVLSDVMGKRMASMSRLLDAADKELNGPSARRTAPGSNTRFLCGRIKRLKTFQNKIESLWNSPTIKIVMK